jgi:hypothetical protein
MPRFVVQKHFRAADDYHFDLMLECGDALVTFQCGAPPELKRELPCLVHQLPDHRTVYLAYQGPISGGRGWCEIHDRGTFEWVEPAGDHAASPCDLADRIAVRLAGQRARGLYRFARETASGTDVWRMSADDGNGRNGGMME